MPWFRRFPRASPQAAAASGIRLRFERRHSGSVEPRRHRAPDFELSPILKPLAPLRDQINVMSGLAHLQADTFGDGTGDHPRASAVWLTGVHAYDRTQPGMEVRLATTADQLAAREIGKDTQAAFARIESWTIPRRAPAIRGDCFYVNTVSWRNETTPNPTESHPRIVFRAAVRRWRQRRAAARAGARAPGSILDSVTQEANRLAGTLWAPATAPSSTNIWIPSARSSSAFRTPKRRALQSIELPERPDRHSGDSFEEHTKLMFDLQAAGLSAPTSRASSA